jgi:Mycobacterium membrane protein
MTNSPRGDGNEPTQPLGPPYPGYSDPAYAGQTPYGPGYYTPAGPNPTQQLPEYGQYGYDPYATDQYGAYPPGPPAGGPRSPRWLWVAAIVVALVVIGLVIALVITNSANQQTFVAPLTPLSEPSTATTTTRTPTTTSRTSTAPLAPLPGTSTTPAPPPASGTEQTTYDVTGEGRAISITYLDSGGVLQTEFNVMLPWHKDVELTSPAKDSASVSVINVGRNVTCTVTIKGVRVQQNTGSGLTICFGAR